MNDHPEINLAKRLVKRYGLLPPIDVVSLAMKYADVVFDNIPFDIDGVCLNLKVSGKRPRIIVNDSAPNTRKRFTLAHEMGHVIIPWHFGSIIDKTDPIEPLHNKEYWFIETEANRFASELLIPEEWTKGIINIITDVTELIDTVVVNTQVSPIAATIKISGLLPPGYVYCNINDEGSVLYSGRSEGTFACAPQRGTRVDPKTLYDYCEFNWDFTIHGQRFCWWLLPNSVNVPFDNDTRDWSTVLDDILRHFNIYGDRRQSIKLTINGIFGYVNGIVRGAARSEPALYAACIQRFHSKEDLNVFVNHPDFDLFLRKRVHSIIAREN